MTTDDNCFKSNICFSFQGCKTSMLNFVENNLLYVGITAGVIVILQVIIDNYIITLIMSVSFGSVIIFIT